jgi:hypothetical protein
MHSKIRKTLVSLGAILAIASVYNMGVIKASAADISKNEAATELNTKISSSKSDDKKSESNNDAELSVKLSSTGGDSIIESWGSFIQDKIKEKKKEAKETTKGHATGKYAVSLKDGDYYWFHQSTSGCVNSCSEDGSTCFGRTTWGTERQSFASTACTQYSAAMIVSNLTGKVVTIEDLLMDLGATFWVYEDGSEYCDVKTIPSGCIAEVEYGSTWSAGEAPEIARIYGLETTGELSDLGKDEAKAKVDYVLARGGMIWMRYGNPYASEMEYGNTAWPGRHTNSHYICIRNSDKDGYYILDSSVGLCYGDEGYYDYINKPVSFDTLWEYSSGNENGFNSPRMIIGFWNPNDGKAKAAEAPDNTIIKGKGTLVSEHEVSKLK